MPGLRTLVLDRDLQGGVDAAIASSVTAMAAMAAYSWLADESVA
ncbi:hypothetical protein [Plantactinospora soyae]|uniref:Uncharacterized protein n=1 Tax=Plantactinospora soyae TaxID=1544732 RepID=A0A927MAB9_9ACTN|nr:hypothetical protein [Plantactinospora soyae]MBE1490774.1 hypothetical protein [Plantactinospora soyae]